MIGNDIVDLELAAVQSNWRRPGFLGKVFTAAEVDCILSSEDQDLYVWLLWSMKEAAYKAHQRRFSLPRHLNWKLQDCSVKKLLNASSEGIVSIGKEKYLTFTDIISNAIHTIAVEEKGTGIRKGFFQLSSEAARRHFLRQVALEKSVDLQALALEKNKEGVPFISLHDRPLSEAFSLSAHGRFSGFCHPLRKP